MSQRHEEIGIELARGQLGDIVDRAHHDGVITYLTRHGNRFAAVIPIGSRASAIPDSAIDAAMDAAWPGLPDGISLSQARRRTVAALNAAYPHLADLLDKVERQAVEGADGRTLRARLETVVNEELATPAPALVRQLADLIDEARIRARQSAQPSTTEK